MNLVFTAKLVQRESEKPVEVCMVCKDVVSEQHWSVLAVGVGTFGIPDENITGVCVTLRKY